MSSGATKRRWFALNAGASNWLWLTLAVLAIDQWTKQLIVERFVEFERLVVLPILNIVRYHNEGAAWSFLAEAGGWQRWFFITLGIVVSLGILVWLRRLPPHGQHLLAAGLE
ncbi:MAG: signal peptidase II, partial [Gammaproteobacteria bacterium]|nr:signal peptidase II [Gammaproteobacteria bacterium]